MWHALYWRNWKTFDWLLVKPGTPEHGTPEQHHSGTRNTGTLKILNYSSSARVIVSVHYYKGVFRHFQGVQRASARLNFAQKCAGIKIFNKLGTI